VKEKKRSKKKNFESLPARQLELELGDLRSELRVTVRAYTSRLEEELSAVSAAVKKLAGKELPTREEIYRVRDCAMMIRQRRLRPEKGRTKDLRKLDALLSEIRPLMEKAD
jgi:hypothetical protein